jgi:hypothetical protein
MKRLEKLVSREKPVMIISVGDVVSENMTKHGVSAQLIIVDNRVMRQPIEPVMMEAKEVIRVKNPAGTITEEAWRAVKNALKQKRLTKIVVDGEEDLLALPVLLHAPLNALVVYGQPYEGIVAIKVTQQKKEKARRIIRAMEPITKS